MVIRDQPETKTRYTLAEFHAFANDPDNADKLYELIDGEIVKKTGYFTPSEIAVTIGMYIGIWARETRLGYVTGADGSYAISDDNEFIPDVGYISKERLPDIPSRGAPVPPDLAVEVKSPNDRVRAMRRKTEKYLERGTKLVWLVFPDEQIVEVYATDADVQVFKIGDTLTGGDVLPGFTLVVKDIFEA